MQLSSSLPPVGLPVAGSSGSVVGGGDVALPIAPAAEGALAFAQLFPDLAPANTSGIDATPVLAVVPQPNRLGPIPIAGWRGIPLPELAVGPGALPEENSPETDPEPKPAAAEDTAVMTGRAPWPDDSAPRRSPVAEVGNSVAVVGLSMEPAVLTADELMGEHLQVDAGGSGLGLLPMSDGSPQAGGLDARATAKRELPATARSSSEFTTTEDAAMDPAAEGSRESRGVSHEGALQHVEAGFAPTGAERGTNLQRASSPLNAAQPFALPSGLMGSGRSGPSGAAETAMRSPTSSSAGPVNEPSVSPDSVFVGTEASEERSTQAVSVGGACIPHVLIAVDRRLVNSPMAAFAGAPGLPLAEVRATPPPSFPPTIDRRTIMTGAPMQPVGPSAFSVAAAPITPLASGEVGAPTLPDSSLRANRGGPTLATASEGRMAGASSADFVAAYAGNSPRHIGDRELPARPSQDLSGGPAAMPPPAAAGATPGLPVMGHGENFIELPVPQAGKLAASVAPVVAELAAPQVSVVAELAAPQVPVVAALAVPQVSVAGGAVSRPDVPPEANRGGSTPVSVSYGRMAGGSSADLVAAYADNLPRLVGDREMAARPPQDLSGAPAVMPPPAAASAASGLPVMGQGGNLIGLPVPPAGRQAASVAPEVAELAAPQTSVAAELAAPQASVAGDAVYSKSADGAFTPALAPLSTPAGVTSALAPVGRVEGEPSVDNPGAVVGNMAPSEADSEPSAMAAPEASRGSAAAASPVDTGAANPGSVGRQGAVAPASLAPATSREKDFTATPVLPSENVVRSTAAVAAESSSAQAAEVAGTGYRENGNSPVQSELAWQSNRSAVGPGARLTGPLTGRAANLAAVYAGRPPLGTAEAKTSVGTFSNPAPGQIADGDFVFGTDIANSAPAMATGAFPRPPSSNLGEHALPLATATLTGEPPRPVAVPLAAAAYRAVNAVLEATERFAAGGAQTVNLRFSVDGSDLAVRVELRGGEVHATFRTDSNELRTALAQEWQTMSGSEAGRPLRAIDPVFAPAKSAGFGAASGESAPHQHRDSGGRQSDEPTHSRMPGQPAAASLSPSVSSAPAPRPATAATTLRLHTFA